MASNFIPMLSSSPPPLDDCPDDDDEEFGTFTSANIAFDSSFDSPVAGEKYKSILKTGENGINDYHAPFALPTQNFTLKLKQQNQTNHVKDSVNEEIIISNSECIVEDDCYSSTVELSLNNEDCLKTSQNCVPGDSKCDLLKENDRSRRKELNDLNSVHSNFRSCDVEDSLPVPPCDEIGVTEKSKDNYIPCGGDGDSLENGDIGFSDCDGSLDLSENGCEGQNTVQDSFSIAKENRENDSGNKFTANFSDGYEKHNTIQDPSSIAKENSENDSGNKFTANFCDGYEKQNTVQDPSSIAKEISEIDSENKLTDNFSDNGKYGPEDDFNAFQGVPSLDEIPVQGGLFSNTSAKEEEPFEANFDDFQTYDGHKSSEPPSDVKEIEDLPDDSEEFADFKAADEDFDNFQSFDKAPEISSTKAEAETSSANPSVISNDLSNIPGQDEDDFDDFDDFQACTKVAAPVEPGFAAFKEEPSADKEEDSEFADFEQASFSSASGETFPNSPCLSSSSHNQEKTVDKLSTVMNAIFQLQEPINDTDVPTDLDTEIVDQSVKGRRLWEKLHEAEQTPGLRFQWGVSHSFQQLLRSVNVDYHSILRTSSVPIFASGLSLLEPVKGQSGSASADSEDRPMQSPRDPIPPVEFDWTSSGLVNPLDTGQSASVLMDLSFLSSSGSTSSSAAVGDHSFENELLKPSPPSAIPETSKTFLLEELLSKNISSVPNSNLVQRPSNLSQEANAVLDQLPNLSYMRAKVLMFPIT